MSPAEVQELSRLLLALRVLLAREVPEVWRWAVVTFTSRRAEVLGQICEPVLGPLVKVRELGSEGQWTEHVFGVTSIFKVKYQDEAEIREQMVRRDCRVWVWEQECTGIPSPILPERCAVCAQPMAFHQKAKQERAAAREEKDHAEAVIAELLAVRLSDVHLEWDDAGEICAATVHDGGAERHLTRREWIAAIGLGAKLAPVSKVFTAEWPPSGDVAEPSIKHGEIKLQVFVLKDPAPAPRSNGGPDFETWLDEAERGDRPASPPPPPPGPSTIPAPPPSARPRWVELDEQKAAGS